MPQAQLFINEATNKPATLPVCLGVAYLYAVAFVHVLYDTTS